tara:strand:+ start:416 stop:715 length:300 start_codon:yes stop_codon:yes gene_type:complete
MGKFQLTNKAVEDLSKIWNYTFEFWSENQADKYYKMLISHCQEIADNPVLGKNYDEITQNLLGIKASKHIIFYKVIGDHSVEVIRILHERMDLKKRITE